MLRVFAALDAGSGEGEWAIEHPYQALRLSPRQSGSHELDQLLAYANFIVKRSTEGVGWALQSLRDMPSFMPTPVNLVVRLVGAGEIDKARATFAHDRSWRRVLQDQVGLRVGVGLIRG